MPVDTELSEQKGREPLETTPRQQFSKHIKWKHSFLKKLTDKNPVLKDQTLKRKNKKTNDCCTKEPEARPGRFGQEKLETERSEPSLDMSHG